MRQLVLDAVLHLCFDLGAFLLALRDELGHAVVGRHEDPHATFQELCFDLLVGALVRLSVQFKLESLDLADQVGLLIRVGE